MNGEAVKDPRLKKNEGRRSLSALAEYPQQSQNK